MNLSSEFFEHFGTVPKKITSFSGCAVTKRNNFTAQNTNQNVTDCALSRFFCANFRFLPFPFAPYDEKSAVSGYISPKSLSNVLRGWDDGAYGALLPRSGGYARG